MIRRHVQKRRGGLWSILLLSLLVFAVASCDDKAEERGCAEDCPLLTHCDAAQRRCVAPDTFDANAVDSAPSLAVTDTGQIMVVAVASESGDLVFGLWDEGEDRFRYQSVGANASPDLSLALSAEGVPGILWRNDAHNQLEYTYWNTEHSAWSNETVESTSDVGREPHLYIDATGHAHASYYDSSDRALRYAERRDGFWFPDYVDIGRDEFNDQLLPEEVCPTGLRVFGVGLSSRVIIQGTTPIIAYHDSDCGQLRLARRIERGKWTLRVVDGVESNSAVGRFIDLALDPLDNIVLAYFDNTQGELKMTILEGGSQTEATVDDGVRRGDLGPPQKYIVGQRPALAFTPEGEQAVIHMNAATQRLLLSTSEDQAQLWHTSTLPESAGEGVWSDLIIDRHGVYHIVSVNRLRDSIEGPPLRLTRLSPDR